MSRAPEVDSTSPPPAAPSQRRIALRLGPLPEGVPSLPYQDGVEQFLIEHRLLPTWPAILADFPGITVRRLFFTLPPAEIARLQGRAMHLMPGAFNNLLRYFTIDVPTGRDPHDLLTRIQDIPIVEEAYLESPVTPPPSPTAAGTAVIAQGYLDAAPGGIGASVVRGIIPNAKGEGIQFADVEQGWYLFVDNNGVCFLNHDDLLPDPVVGHPNRITMPGWGGSCANLMSHRHGTHVMGIVRSIDDGGGCIGIAPESNGYCVCEIRPSAVLPPARADAILSAASNLNVGDVLLLEMQVTDGSSNLAQLWPVEIEPANRDAISVATAIGIVVIEATGNGADYVLTSSGQVPPGGGLGNLDAKFPQLVRGTPQFADTGAVVVAGASSAHPHVRLVMTRYGSRVDCYAWGENVGTTDNPPVMLCNGGPAPAQGYVPSAGPQAFGDSSAASAIVAGAALVTQSMHRGAYGFPTGPWRVRALLKDPTTGTTSNDPIGVMPDLARIAPVVLPNLRPDVYVRDYVGDTGAPHTGPISMSPDIIVRRAPVANPTAEFGPASGHADDIMLSQSVRQGQDHSLYVRIRNRAQVNSGPVDVNVYWSEVATLITPSMWRHIGADHSKPSVIVPNVPVGDVLTVSDRITWLANEVPGAGHYCFVGLVGCNGDPDPHPLYLGDWDAFLKFIRNNNNVTWRNFNVIEGTEMAQWVGGQAIPFLVAAAEDKAVQMRLEVIGKLPDGVQIAVDVPDDLQTILGSGPFSRGHAFGLAPAGQEQTTQVLGEGEFSAGAKWPCGLRLVSNPSRVPVHGEVSVRQLTSIRRDWFEVGRATWRFKG